MADQVICTEFFVKVPCVKVGPAEGTVMNTYPAVLSAEAVLHPFAFLASTCTTIKSPAS